MRMVANFRPRNVADSGDGAECCACGKEGYIPNGYTEMAESAGLQIVCQECSGELKSEGEDNG